MMLALNQTAPQPLWSEQSRAQTDDPGSEEQTAVLLTLADSFCISVSKRVPEGQGQSQGLGEGAACACETQTSQTCAAEPGINGAGSAAKNARMVAATSCGPASAGTGRPRSSASRTCLCQGRVQGNNVGMNTRARA
jgi:hypothetical protein